MQWIAEIAVYGNLRFIQLGKPNNLNRDSKNVVYRAEPVVFTKGVLVQWACENRNDRGEYMAGSFGGPRTQILEY